MYIWRKVVFSCLNKTFYFQFSGWQRSLNIIVHMFWKEYKNGMKLWMNSFIGKMKHLISRYKKFRACFAFGTVVLNVVAQTVCTVLVVLL